MANKWGSTKMEYVFDGFTINALAQRGEEKGLHLVYQHNLNTIERHIESTDVVTRLRGRGKNGLTIEGLDIANIPEEDLEGFSYKGGKISKDYVDSEFIVDYANPKENIMRWEYIENQLDLFNVMKEYIKTVDTPKITYQVSFIEFAKQGLQEKELQLGDVIYVIDEDLGIEEQVRIIELNKNPIRLELSTATLATKRKSIIDYLAQISNTRKYVDVKVEELESKIDSLKNRLIDTEDILTNPNAVHNNEGIFSNKVETLDEKGKNKVDTQLLKISDGVIHRSIDSGHSLLEVITPHGIKADQFIGDATIRDPLIVGEEEFKHIYGTQLTDQSDLESEPETIMTIGNYIHSVTGEEKNGIQIKKENLDVIGDLGCVAVFA